MTTWIPLESNPEVRIFALNFYLAAKGTQVLSYRSIITVFFVLGYDEGKPA